MELLRFKVGPDVFALPIERVIQIIGQRPVTRVPGVSSCVGGVFNHEGLIVALVDLRKKFDADGDATKRRACIVIVSAEHKDRRVPIGLLTDGFLDVTHVQSDAIDSAPAFGLRVRLDYLAGLTKIGDGFTLILNVDRFLNTAELLDLAAVREQVPA